MEFLIVIAAIGGFIKIIETSVKVGKYIRIVISNIKFMRRVNRNLKLMAERKNKERA